jgi:hypothetical protein
MTAPANKTPLSVDYTGRDYYAIRAQLIERVKERTGNNWQGTDPSDFGLALVEAFAYMGDLLNYYIDRVANESYIKTATQRDTLLNLAQLYGYTPANYVSSLVDLYFTNNVGYSGSIGAAIIESGTIGSTSYENIAKIIVPNDHPFVAGNQLIVGGVPTTTTGYISGLPEDYNTSVYNGQFTVAYVGYNNFGKNVVWYVPSATISNITTSGTTFTVTSSGSLNAFEEQKIQISGVSVAGGANGYNGTWVVSSTTEATATAPATFTVDSADSIANISAVHPMGSGGTAKVVFSAWNDFVVGQKVDIRNVKSSDNTGGTAGSGYNFTGATVSAVKKAQIEITGVDSTSTPGSLIFTVSEPLEVGDYVNITGIKSDGNETGEPGQGYNVTNTATNGIVTGVSTVTATVTNVVGDTNDLGIATFTTASAHGFTAGQYVTMTGITSSLNAVTTSVYNMKSALIVSVTTNTFVVKSYWTDTFVSGGTATLNKFTIANAYSHTNATRSGGKAVCRQFKITNTKATTVTDVSSATATPLIGGTYSTGGTVYYSQLPAVNGMGGASIGSVRNVGFTTIPKGTQASAQVSSANGTETVTFSTLAAVEAPFKGTVSVLSVQGEDVSLRAENAENTAAVVYDIAGEKIGISDGTADQSFALKETKVDPRSVRVFVDSGTSFDEWTQVSYLMDYGAGSTVFAVRITAAGQVFVDFGDGISGAIPSGESTIKAVYVAGGGVIGNVAAGKITTLGAVPGLTLLGQQEIKNNVTVTNVTDATGGGDPESNDSIRFNTPKSLRSLNRAVTLTDYSNLALTVPGVSKANASATNRSSVTLYVAPIQSGTSDIYPGFYTGGEERIETSQLEYLRTESVPGFILDKVQIGTTLTVLSPTYTDIYMEVTYTALPQFTGSTVEGNIKSSITSVFSFENLQFADVITPEEVEFKLRQVTGVQNAKVTALYRTGGSGRNSLVGTPDEIFVFSENGMVLTQADSTATLSTVTLIANDSTGSPVTPVTWSTLFRSGVYNYQVNVPATTRSVVITPTATSAFASITVNDKNTTAPVTVKSYTVNSAEVFDPIIINVTAGDGVTVNSYAVSVIVG